MNDKKLRKLSKKELFEILLSQSKKIKELEEELKTTKQSLETKRIIISEAGSLAEASLKLNGIFESAEIAIEQYRLNIEEQCQNMIKETKKICQAKKDKITKDSTTKRDKKKRK